MAVDSLRADLVIEDPGEEILLLFKIELEGDSSPWISLGSLIIKSALME